MHVQISFSMGIRGLTTFVAQYSYKFLQDHDLHNTYLVLDGNNICCQLYIWHTTVHDCFGGDYDTFARVVETFFEALTKCKIIPIVVFDGNYEWKKLKTCFARYRDKIRSTGRLTPATEGRLNYFPQFTTRLFGNVVKKLNLHAYRCELEADNELACLARALNCPVLSYDSDFYIFDVLYIPFNTLSFVPKYNKLRNAWYLPCKLYKTENFLKSFPGLRREHLPLMATLLGNDYIKSSVFTKFYSQLKLQRCQSRTNPQQRRIRTVIEWLRTETFESAVCKILNRLKMYQRKNVAKKIDLIVKGYICCDSVVLRDLDIKYRPTELSVLDLKYDLDDLIENCNKIGNLLADNQTDCQSEEDEVEAVEEAELASHMSRTLNITDDEALDKQDEAISSYKDIPSWFVKKHYLCEYPLTIYEIAHSIYFFFTPLLEDYSNITSHSICYSIVSAINKILTQTICDGKERLLRAIGRGHNDTVSKFNLVSFEKEVVSLTDIPNLTENERLDFMLDVLDLTSWKNDLTDVPADWRLLIVSVIYWIKNATVQIKPSHTFSVFLCAIILKVVDKKLGALRNLTRLRSKYAKLLSNSTNIVECSLSYNIYEVFSKISASESAFAMSALIPHFQMSDKIARNHKQYDIRIVDAFGQLQCCIFYIGALNSLLNEPLDKLIISDFYNGTFLYNLFTNLNKRTDIVTYLKQLLPNSPNVVKACLIFEKLLGVQSSSVTTQKSANKNRKKNRKSKNINNIKLDVPVIKKNEIETFVDENNSYSMLSIDN